MGSAAIHVHDDDLHVGFDGKMWWAVGKEGSYGGSINRQTAVNTAIDASATGFHGLRKVVVHYRYGGVAWTILRTRRTPSRQFHQDDVP
jgi:hypothetical protein